MQHLQERCGNSKTATVAYFYCTRNNSEPERGDGVEIFRSLVKQLSISTTGDQIRFPTVTEYTKRVEEARQIGEDPSRLTADECVELICELTRDVEITIAIDALDECRPMQRAAILDAIGHIVSSTRNVVKVFVSSRDEEPISARLRAGKHMEITQTRTEEDMKNFVLTRTRLFVRNWAINHEATAEDLQGLEKRIFDALIQGAQGM